jgi:hypothetical protein
MDQYFPRILESALVRKYGKAELEPLTDSFEVQAHDAVYKMITGA